MHCQRPDFLSPYGFESMARLPFRVVLSGLVWLAGNPRRRRQLFLMKMFGPSRRFNTGPRQTLSQALGTFAELFYCRERWWGLLWNSLSNSFNASPFFSNWESRGPAGHFSQCWLIFQGRQIMGVLSLQHTESFHPELCVCACIDPCSSPRQIVMYDSRATPTHTVRN